LAAVPLRAVISGSHYKADDLGYRHSQILILHFPPYGVREEWEALLDVSKTNKGRQMGGMAALMSAQAQLASRLRDADGLCPPCSYKISLAGFTGNRDVCADCQQAARPINREKVVSK
jgi:hypothetical protein